MRRRWKVLIGFGVGIVLAAVVLHPPLTSQDWAAWVQAVGSIGAIAGAVFISKEQQKAVERHQEISPLRNLVAIYQRAEYLARQVPDTRSDHTELVVDSFVDNGSNADYQAMKRTLVEFPIYTLQDDRAVAALLGMQTAFGDLAALVGTTLRDDDYNVRVNTAIDNLYPFEECKEALDVAYAKLLPALKERGIE